MMGGLTLYCDGQIFAIVTGEERIYLKAAGRLAEALAAEGAEQFAYTRRDGVTARMGYWSLPDAALDDPEAACDWARRALADRRLTLLRSDPRPCANADAGAGEGRTS